MPEKKAKASRRGAHKLVRGADGSLFIVSEDKPPRKVKLKKEEADAVQQILAEAARQVQKRLIGAESTRGSTVNVDVSSLAELPS